MNDDIKALIEEIKKSATEQLGGLSTKQTEIIDRLTALEQKGIAAPGAGQATESIADYVLKSQAWNQIKQGARTRIDIPQNVFEYARKTAIVNASGQNQPLVPSDRTTGIIAPAQRKLFLRDLLPSHPTQSNLIEFTKELTFTNNAGPQYSSPNRENVTKPESAMTFSLATAPVVTLAHWIPVSKQVYDDSAMLQGHLGPRMMYGLKLEEEDQLLNGDGASGNLSGLLHTGNFTAYSRAVSGDTAIDTIRRSLTQLALADMMATVIVLNPADWEEIELLKDGENRYLLNQQVSRPAVPTLFGVPVVSTNTIAAGTFATSDLPMAAALWDRQQATLEFSREDGTNFVKNMITVLAEERVALTVFRPTATIKGSL
jgi:HK97 family phage major capsid protein